MAAHLIGGDAREGSARKPSAQVNFLSPPAAGEERLESPRSERNLLATLLLAQGTPALMTGHEHDPGTL